MAEEFINFFQTKTFGFGVEEVDRREEGGVDDGEDDVEFVA